MISGDSQPRPPLWRAAFPGEGSVDNVLEGHEHLQPLPPPLHDNGVGRVRPEHQCRGRQHQDAMNTALQEGGREGGRERERGRKGGREGEREGGS